MARVLIAGSVKMVLSIRADHLPLPGETVPGTDNWAWEPGGKGLNQATAAARAGASVALVGRVGTDPEGDTISHYLLDNQISNQHLARSPTKPTGMSCVWVDQTSGENAIVSSAGATAELSASDISAIRYMPGDVAVSQFSAPPAFVEAFLTEAASHPEVTTILNAAPAKPLTPALLEAVNIFLVNEGEMASYLEQFERPEFDLSDPASVQSAALDLRRTLDVDVVVATLGDAGLVAVNRKDHTLIIPGQKVTAQDTTGAGDCFLGNLAAQLALGQDLETALLWANTASALQVQTEGAAAAMPAAAATQSALPATPGHVL